MTRTPAPMGRPGVRRVLLATALAALGAATSGLGAEWHVAPTGSPDGDGSAQGPWDLASTLAGERPVAPGDTVWIAAGNYRHPDRSTGSMGFAVTLAGTAEAPVRVAAVPGTRVTIDGGLAVKEPAAHLRLEALEILVSENFSMPRRVEEPGSHPKSYGRPWGGLNIYAGEGCKFIHLIIHHNAQGVSWWTGSTNSELYGCMIYDNGWDAPDRGHGHAIYTQNRTGVKTISDCLMTGGFGQTMHAYGSARAYVDHYVIEHNAAWKAGRFLIGGGRPSRDIRVAGNSLHQVDLQLGYNAPHNENCTVVDNTIVNGQLTIQKFRDVEKHRNLVVGANDARPDSEPLVIVRPSKYDPQRAHLIVYNWRREAVIRIDPAGFLRPGDAWRLHDPADFFGEPLAKGSISPSGSGEIEAPLEGEFAAWVLLRSP